MTEQRDVMQLLGVWGHTPLSFYKYLEHEFESAKDVGDAVGMTMYKSLMALTRYAQTSDEKSSVMDKVGLDPRMQEMVGEEVFEDIKASMSEDEFPVRVIEAIYETCCEHKSVQEAEMKLRRNVLLTVVPFIIDKIQKNASEISSTILQMLIGAEASMSAGKIEAELSAKTASDNMKVVVEKLLGVSEQIIMCKNTPDEDVNHISSVILGDIIEVIKDISEDILSIIDKPPHLWVEYATSFGRFMVSFQLATSLGYVDYDTYNRIFKDIKSLKNVNTPQKLTFGRN